MAGPFTPGDVALESYTFLSHVRSGLATAMAGAPGQVTAGVPVFGDGVARHPAAVQIRLRGPGDVLSLDERQIVRRHPADGAAGVEPGYLAHVEFDQPGLPWLFTPLPAAPRLTPWLVLVVLAEGR